MEQLTINELIDKGRYREVQRIALELESIGISKSFEIEDRLNQLNSGIIFYPDRFWAALKYWSRNLLTLRCGLCKRRHWKNPLRHQVSEGYVSTCFYGYKWELVHGFGRVIAYAQNGDD